MQSRSRRSTCSRRIDRARPLRQSGYLRTGLLLTLAVGGCSVADPEPHWTVSDSASVRITTSTPGSVPEVTPTELVLTLGTVGDGGPTEFFRVRDVEIVDSAEIVVANAGSEEVRAFSLEGTFLRRFGREGRGPRDFTRLEMVQEWGDSLMTYDAGNDRIAIRLPDGTFVRSYRLEWFSGLLSLVDLSEPARTVATTARHMTELSGTGVVVDTSLVSLYDEDGRLIDSIARLPHNARFVKQVGDMRTTVGAPYSAWASIVGWGTGFCYAFGPAPEVRCFGGDGALTEIWRVTDPPRPLEDTHVARYWDDVMDDMAATQSAAAVENYRGVVQRVRDDMIFPEHFPGIVKLAVDDAGRVWAQRYRLPDEAVETWWVFDEGRLVERVSSPVGFELMDVESGMLAGVWRDEFDVEHVRLYRWRG